MKQRFFNLILVLESFDIAREKLLESVKDLRNEAVLKTKDSST